MNLSTDPINTVENLKARNRITGPSIYLIIVIALVLASALLPFIYVDISSQSRGIVRSRSEDVSVQTAVGGKISYVNLVKNQIVTKGDTLLRISNAEILTKMAHNDSILKTADSLRADYRRLINKNYNGIRTSKVVELYKSFKTEILISKEKLKMARLKFDRHKQLYESGVISRSQFEKVEFGYREASRTLNMLMQQNRMSWESQVLELKGRLRKLENNSISLKTENDNHFLIAPISGTLDQVTGLEEGSIVSIAQKVAVISPDTELIVENTVRPEEIGLIKVGQAVKYRIDAFHFQNLGIPTGSVMEIDKNISLDKQRPYFRVYCDFEIDELAPKKGYPIRFFKGMTVTTHYYLSRRSLLELIFDKINLWVDPSSIDNSALAQSK